MENKHNNKPLILVTNDDGIDSPGLWAAAASLMPIGEVVVVAPREQYTSAGRSMPLGSDGIIQRRGFSLNGYTWEGYAIGGSPAQAVVHAFLEILPRYPDLVVSGINFGENVGTGVTISGTVGAALEAASVGVPALAISLETPKEHHLSNSHAVDFSTAAHFTGFFANLMLGQKLPNDVDILKIEVPDDATPETSWATTHLSRDRYYKSLPPKRTSWDVPGKLDYETLSDLSHFSPDSDAYTLAVKRLVSVTPLSVDLTSRVDLTTLTKLLK